MSTTPTPDADNSDQLSSHDELGMCDDNPDTGRTDDMGWQDEDDARRSKDDDLDDAETEAIIRRAFDPIERAAIDHDGD